MEQLNLRVRWGARREGLGECSNRALQFLQRLQKCDPTFAQWFECGESLEEALSNKVELSAKWIHEFFHRGRSKEHDDLGFRPHGLWNGFEAGAAHVSFACGLYPDAALLPGPNYVLLEFPFKGEEADRILQPVKLSEISRAAAEIWDPDWIRVSNYEMDKIIHPEGRYKGQKVGWITYVSDRYGRLPALSPECEVTRIDDLGNLILITSIQKVTASNPAHVASIRRLSETLERAGMLAPTPPG